MVLALALVNTAVAEGLFFASSNDGNATNGKVLSFNAASGEFLRIAGGPFGDDIIHGITVGPDGLLYISALNTQPSPTINERVLRYDLKGNFVDVFLEKGLAADGKIGTPDGLGNPGRLRFGPDGHLYVIANAPGSDEVLRFDGETGEFLGFAAVGLITPQDIVFDSDGLMYVTNGNIFASSIYRFDYETGQFVDVFVPTGSGGLEAPTMMAFGPDGNLYVASFPQKAVFRFDGETGAFIDIFVDLSTIGAQGSTFPVSIVFGPDGNLYTHVVFSGPVSGIYRFSGDDGTIIDEWIEPGSGGLKLANGGMLFVDQDCERFNNPGLANNCFLPTTVNVDIDINPGSDSNCLNINGSGVIPVAILGSASFDVADVDITTLSFGGLAVRMRGKKGPICGYEDSNDDGIQDLVCHFEDDPSAWSVGSDSATLSGELLDGSPFEGSDSICVVP
jgi:outer membrane protein assembly factor BamB